MTVPASSASSSANANPSVASRPVTQALRR